MRQADTWWPAAFSDAGWSNRGLPGRGIRPGQGLWSSTRSWSPSSWVNGTINGPHFQVGPDGDLFIAGQNAWNFFPREDPLQTGPPGRVQIFLFPGMTTGRQGTGLFPPASAAVSMIMHTDWRFDPLAGQWYSDTHTSPDFPIGTAFRKPLPSVNSENALMPWWPRKKLSPEGDELSLPRISAGTKDRCRYDVAV